MIRLPVDRTNRAVCGDLSPAGLPCQRTPGHYRRHAFWWRHLDGRLREVWGNTN